MQQTATNKTLEKMIPVLKDLPQTPEQAEALYKKAGKVLSKPKKAKKPKLPKVDKNDSVIIAWSDWQLGKPDGDGTAAIVERLNQMIPDFKDYVLKLRKGGKKLKNLHIISLGDII